MSFSVACPGCLYLRRKLNSRLIKSDTRPGRDLRALVFKERVSEVGKTPSLWMKSQQEKPSAATRLRLHRHRKKKRTTARSSHLSSGTM